MREMIDIKTYLLDILSIREIGLQLRLVTIKRFYIWWCQRGVSKQKISYILVSASCQLRVIEWEGESSSSMGTRSIKIIEGATPISYHTINVYYIATHLSTTSRWEVYDCQSKPRFDDHPTVSTSTTDQRITNSVVFGGRKRSRPRSYPALFRYKLNIVLLAVGRGWYHTRLSSIVKRTTRRVQTY